MNNTKNKYILLCSLLALSLQLVSTNHKTRRKYNKANPTPIAYYTPTEPTKTKTETPETLPKPLWKIAKETITYLDLSNPLSIMIPIFAASNIITTAIVRTCSGSDDQTTPEQSTLAQNIILPTLVTTTCMISCIVASETYDRYKEQRKREQQRYQ